MELEADAALGENNAQRATDARNESQMRRLYIEVERDREKARDRKRKKERWREKNECEHKQKLFILELPRGTKVE